MVTIEFVRGWFFRACQVDPSMNELVTTSNDEAILKEIGTFLRGERINCTVAGVAGRYRLRVRDLDSLRTWRDKIGFPRDIDRATKLTQVIHNLESKNA